MSIKKSVRGFTTYDSYVFTDQDPVVDKVRTAMKDTKMNAYRIQAKSRVAASTINNWMSKKTKRPQYATVCAAMGAMGYKPEWVATALNERLRKAA